MKSLKKKKKNNWGKSTVKDNLAAEQKDLEIGGVGTFILFCAIALIVNKQNGKHDNKVAKGGKEKYCRSIALVEEKYFRSMC